MITAIFPTLFRGYFGAFTAFQKRFCPVAISNAVQKTLHEPNPAVSFTSTNTYLQHHVELLEGAVDDIPDADSPDFPAWQARASKTTGKIADVLRANMLMQAAEGHTFSSKPTDVPG